MSEKNKQELLEETGYSYSGAVNEIGNGGQGDAEELLKQINETYLQAKKTQEKYEKLAKEAQSKRGDMISMFVHCANIVGIKQGESLIFYDRDKSIVKVEVKSYSDQIIDYEKFSLTSLKQK